MARKLTNDRQLEILRWLNLGVTIRFLAVYLRCPQASIRREIHALRQRGHQIATEGGGFYRLERYGFTIK